MRAAFDDLRQLAPELTRVRPRLGRRGMRETAADDATNSNPVGKEVA